MPTDEAGTATPSPEDAFEVLGNETRMEILRTLGRADGPLSFSELRERVGMRDSGQFNYHLDRVRGHFLDRTEEGYRLSRAGHRVIQAVLSGAITEAPVLELTEVDVQCVYCGGSTAVEFRDGELRHYCTDCSGTYGDAVVGPDPSTAEGTDAEELGFIGKMALPPAGVRRRTPAEVFETTAVWGALELLAIGRGVCPRCSAPVERSVIACADHGSTEGICGECGRRHAVLCRARCTNCTCEEQGPFAAFCLGTPEVLAVLAGEGVDPLADWAAVDWTEEVLSSEPFEARFTYTAGGQAVTVTVDDTLEVVDVTEPRAGSG